MRYITTYLSSVLFIFCFTMTVSLCLAEESEIMPIYYVERIPYAYKTGDEVHGLIVDPVKMVFEKLDVPYKWKALPVKRIMKYLEENKGRFCTVGWYRTPERENIARYSHYIYQNRTRIAIARADNEGIESGRMVDDILSDLDLKLLVKDGYSYGEYLDKKIEQYDPNLKKTTAESISMIKIVLAGRADYFFISEEEADALIQSSGLNRADFKYIRFLKMPTGLRRHILFSRQVDDELIEKVNAAIITYIHHGEKE